MQHPGAPVVAVDVNLLNQGSGVAMLIFNRMFESHVRGAGLSQFRTTGAFFDLNVYAENYLHRDMFNPGTRVQVMDTLIRDGAFLREQADSFVWALVKMIEDVQEYDPAATEHIIPSGDDISDALIAVELRDVEVSTVRALFTAEMTKRQTLAHECLR